MLEPYVGTSRYANHAQRVVCGQRVIQAASDIFLGWTSSGSTDFYLRQLRDMKLSASIETMSKAGFLTYCRLCGFTLARAHARGGDPALISGYLGKNDDFDQAIATFAHLYADQTERDYEELAAAARDGQISVEVQV